MRCPPTAYGRLRVRCTTYHPARVLRLRRCRRVAEAGARQHAAGHSTQRTQRRAQHATHPQCHAYCENINYIRSLKPPSLVARLYRLPGLPQPSQRRCHRSFCCICALLSLLLVSGLGEASDEFYIMRTYGVEQQRCARRPRVLCARAHGHTGAGHPFGIVPLRACRGRGRFSEATCLARWARACTRARAWAARGVAPPSLAARRAGGAAPPSPPRAPAATRQPARLRP